MAKKLTLQQLINKQVLPKLVTLLVIVCGLVLVSSYMVLKDNIEKNHLQSLERFQSSVEEKISLLKDEVSNLSNNELITNSLIDFESREEYLPIFFRSLRITGAENAAVILTDFEGETITANNEQLFLDSGCDINWQHSVLIDGKSIFNVSPKGILLINPIFYADLPEGAMIVYIPSVTNIFKASLSTNENDISFIISSLSNEILYHSRKGAVQEKSDNGALNPNTFKTHLMSDSLKLRFSTEQNMYAAYDQLITLAALILFTVAIIFVGSIYSNRLSTKIATRSISELKDAIQDLDSNKHGISVTEKDPLEVEELKQTYNNLSSELFTTSQSLSEFEGVINSLNEFLVVLDNKHKHIVCNNAFAQFTETVEIKDRQKLGIDEVILQVLPTELTDNRHAIDTPPSEKIYRTSKDVAFKIIRWRRQEFISPSTNSKGWIYVGSDITHTKAIQADLEMKTKAIDEAKTSIVISKFTPGSPIIYINDAFTKMTGYTKEDSIGRNCSFLQGPATTPESIKEISLAIAEKRAQTTTLLNYKKDGQEFYNELTISPIKNELGEVTHVLGLQVDVSEAERLKQHLSEAKHKAEESNELKSRFLASMSHEIRTPLNGVIGMLNILSESALDDSQIRHTQIAQSSAKALLAIINDILDLSKIEAGKVELEYREVNIVRLISDVAKPMAKLALENNNEIIVDCSELETDAITIDEARVRQILLNLISNALKFTREGQVQICASITSHDIGKKPKKTAGGLWLKCEIKDSGIGIPRNRLSSIFDSFTQADSSTTRKFGGTGLGLSICRQLCAAMGGSIKVDSIEGSGSTFTFTIKLGDRELSAPSYPVFKNRAALLIHEKDYISDSLSKTLSLFEIRCDSSLSMEEAEKRISEHPYDFVFCSETLAKNEQDQASESLSEAHSREQIIDDLVASQITANLYRLSKGSKNSSVQSILLSKIGSNVGSLEDLQPVVNATVEAPYVINEIASVLQNLTQDKSSIEDHLPSTKLNPISAGKSDKSSSAVVPLRKYPVLLVEDNPVNQLVAQGLLSKQNLHIDIAENGQEAIEKLKENASLPSPKQYQAVFMDCQMPVMDGYEATRRIRLGDAGERFLEVPIIAMTANAVKGDKEKCIEVGMNDYIAKPIESDKLNEAVSNWVTRLDRTKSNG